MWLLPLMILFAWTFIVSDVNKVTSTSYSLLFEYYIFCGHPVFSTPFVEETILSPLCILHTVVEDQMAIYAWIYFWALNSIPLLYMSVFMQVPYCFEYCSFVIYFEIRSSYATSVFLLFQDLFGYF